MYKNTVAMCTFIVNNFDTDIKNTCIKERCAHTNKNYCKNNFDTDIAPYYRGVPLTTELPAEIITQANYQGAGSRRESQYGVRQQKY